MSATLALLIVFEVAGQRVLFERTPEAVWFEDALRLFQERHVDPPAAERLVFEAIRGMAESMDDYSDFIDPDQYARFREENEGEYVGVGFVINVQAPPVTVLYAFPGSPAEEAGLLPGDRIVAVDGQDCTGLGHEAVMDRIKLENGAGRPVDLTVQPWKASGAEPAPLRETRVLRRNIERASVFDPRILDAARGVGYVRLAAFQERTCDELRAALDLLSRQGMNALVLDLRRNRGGLLEQAVAVASLFLPPGSSIVRTDGRTEDADEQYVAESGSGVYAGLPLAVLVDRNTASASEVVAGALQDHLKAVLVGERTFGKGMVQSVIQRRYVVDQRERTALLKITTSRYITPSGRILDKDSGLVPDVWATLSKQSEAQLDRHFQDREIPGETWDLIRERTAYRPRAEEGFRDVPLEQAVDVLTGGKVLNPVY